MRRPALHVLHVVTLLAAPAYAPHCPHECPEQSRVVGSGYEDCKGNCRDCEACLGRKKAAEDAEAAAIASAQVKAVAAAAAAAAQISPPPPPPGRDKRWVGECLPSCRKVDQCQEFNCHACKYCEEQVS